MTATAKYFEAALPRPTWVWSTALAVISLWLLLLKELQVDWSIDPQYSYGWGVPPLLLYLFWKRWQDRPAAQRRDSPKLFLVMIGALLFALLPLRLIQEANPDWRLISWLMASTVVILSLCGCWFAGGWSWTKHFVAPVLFILLAVPWPNALEQTLTQSLMRGVTAVTAEGMNWLGLGASTRGNLITLTNGVVGVSAACSGIRSFQTSCMLAIFVGELFRLSLARRMIALLLAIVAAIGLNIVRTSVLTWLCAQRGPDIESAWHDRAGLLMLGLTVATVWGIGHLCARGMSRTGGAVTMRSGAGRIVPGAVALLMAGWVWLAEATVQGWYRLHEQTSRTGQVVWTMKWPQASEGFQRKVLPDEMRKLLRCDESEAGTWRRSDGSEWTIFSFRWRPGRMAAQLAKGHTPDVCLPAIGYKQVAALGNTTVRWRGTDLRFNTYVFEGNSRRYHVFFCQVDDRAGAKQSDLGNEATTYLAGLEPEQRLRAVREGRRHGGHQVLEIAMTGYADQDQAQQALEKALPHLLSAPSTKG